jgi:RNA polymerase primary sigma factor
MIRVPVHRAEQWTKVARTEAYLRQKLGRDPSPHEVADQLDMSVPAVHTAQQQYNDPVSLETPIGRGQDNRLGDLIGDRGGIPPDESVTAVLLSEHTAKVLKTLVPREEFLLRRRYGIGTGHEHTLAEIGQELNITRERVRQLETRALRKLRFAIRRRLLESYVKL